MNAKDWIADFAERLGAEPPSADEMKKILDLAAEAAHASERIAAPAACWLAARAGASLDDALAAAAAVGPAAEAS